MTLRRSVLALGLALLLSGLVAAAARHVLAPQLLALGGVLTFGALCEAWRYKRNLPAPPSATARPTGERFVDPGSGELVEVHCDAHTGERSYVKVPPGHR